MIKRKNHPFDFLDTSEHDLIHQSAKTPQILDEESIGGSTPDPESDDDTLSSAHAVGIALDEDYEHPKPLNIAKNMDDAEVFNKRH